MRGTAEGTSEGHGAGPGLSLLFLAISSAVQHHWEEKGKSFLLSHAGIHTVALPRGAIMVPEKPPLHCTDIL